MHDTEARSGQGHEHRRMRRNRLVDALSALESGSHQMAGVASIERGARGTAQLAPGATGFEHDVVGEVVTREDDSAVLAGKHEATQSDRMGTPAAASSLGQEVVELVLAGVTADGMEHGHIVFVQLFVRHGRHHAERS